MDLQWINGTDDVAEMATKTNINFNALQEGVSGDITTAKTEAITETQTWAKGVFTRKNLLRNSDFKINQRGTSFVAPSNIYTADMWKCNGSGTVTLTSSGMQITGTVAVSYIMSTAEYNKISGKTVTLSYSVNGVILTSTFVVSSATVINLSFTDKTINWMKLEVGSFATTYEYPNSDEETLVCRQHYLKDFVGTAFVYYVTSTEVYFRFSIPPMRIIAPTITVFDAKVGNHRDFVWDAPYSNLYTVTIRGTKTAHGYTANTPAEAQIILNASV